MMTGFILLYRDYLNHPIWRTDEWTRRTWEFLLLSAVHKGNAQQRGTLIGTCELTYSQIVEGTYYIENGSTLKKISRNKLNKVIKYLQENDMITYKAQQGKSITITITNWHKWQHPKEHAFVKSDVDFNNIKESKPDPNFSSGALMELWGRDNLPNSPHYSAHELVLHQLHVQPPHYSFDDLSHIITNVKKYKNDGLEFVWNSGPIRLNKTIHKTGQLVAEYCLNFKGFAKNGKAIRNRTERIAHGNELLDELLAPQANAQRRIG